MRTYRGCGRGRGAVAPLLAALALVTVGVVGQDAARVPRALDPTASSPASFYTDGELLYYTEVNAGGLGIALYSFNPNTSAIDALGRTTSAASGASTRYVTQLGTTLYVAASSLSSWDGSAWNASLNASLSQVAWPVPFSPYLYFSATDAGGLGVQLYRYSVAAKVKLAGVAENSAAGTNPQYTSAFNGAFLTVRARSPPLCAAGPPVAR